MLRVLACLAVLSVCGSARAQASAPHIPYADGETVEVMILGTFHFHNPNADYAQFEGIDVLTPERQREIEAVVDGLARFRPTQIAVELLPRVADTVQEQYDGYLAGTHDLTRNEVQQVSFRLAQRFGLPGVHHVDHAQGLNISGVMGYAAVHDPEVAAWFQTYIQAATTYLDSLQAHATIGENLRVMNTEGALDLAHRAYPVLATIGSNEDPLGAQTAANWYSRNLHIFASLARIAEPGDRVFFMVGQGHAPILRDLVRDHPGFTLVDPLPYLESR